MTDIYVAVEHNVALFTFVQSEFVLLDISAHDAFVVTDLINDGLMLSGDDLLCG